MKPIITSLYLLSIPIICFYCVISTSCSDPIPESRDEIVLPDSLESATDFLQYGIAQLYQTWDFPAAKKALEAAIEMDSTLPAAHAQYGWYLSLMKQNELAKEFMLRAWHLEPGSLVYHTWYGWMCLYAGDYEHGLAQLDSVLTIDSTFIGAHNVKARGLAELGKYELALESLEKSTAHPRFFHMLAYVKARSGDQDGARQVLKDLRKNKELIDHMSFASIHLALGETASAYEELELAKQTRHVYFPFGSSIPVYSELWDDDQFKELYADLSLPIH